MEQHYTTSDLSPVAALLPFREATASNQICEGTDISWKKDGVVKQFLMTLIAEDSGLLFKISRAPRKDPLTQVTPIPRTPEEPLGDEVMLRRVCSACPRWPSVGVTAPNQPASAKGAALDSHPVLRCYRAVAASSPGCVVLPGRVLLKAFAATR
jgi:hypothetical protein